MKLYRNSQIVSVTIYKHIWPMLENVFNKVLSMKSNMSRFPNTREKLKFTQITRQ